MTTAREKAREAVRTATWPANRPTVVDLADAASDVYEPILARTATCIQHALEYLDRPDGRTDAQQVLLRLLRNETALKESLDG